MMKRILIIAISAVLLQLAYGRVVPEEEINEKFIKIEGHPGSNHVRSKRAADRGAQNVYYMSRSAAVWGDAWFECRQGMNGELLSIETLAEDQFIRDFLIKHGIDNVWTSGAFDPALGIWRWLSNGGQATYSNFLPGHPAANDATQRIVFQNSLFSYGWHVQQIPTLNFYICEQTGDPVPQPTPAPPPTEPPPPTTYVHIDPPPALVPEVVTGNPLVVKDEPLPVEPSNLKQYQS